MIFVLPIGHERTQVRRLPHVCIAILALNMLMFGATYLGEGDQQMKVAEYHVRRALEQAERSPHTELSPELLDRLLAKESDRQRLQREIKLQRASTPRPSAEVLRADQDAVDRLCARAIDAMESTYFHRLGFVPAAPRVAALFTSMFIHAGWMHLIGNLLFFYLAGPFLEDVFGRPLFVALYVLGGVAAVFAQWGLEGTTTRAYGGASGAISALMGAFLIRFTTTRIRFAYFFFLLWPFRILFLAVRNAHRLWRGTFWAPAYVMLPLWLVSQFYLLRSSGSEAGVAFWAHIGGFAFGVLFAGLLRITRIEQRWVEPAIEAEITYATHPSLTRAIEVGSAGRHKQARHYLQQALKATPQDPDVWLEQFRNALALGDSATARDAALRSVELDNRAGRHEAAWETYLDAASRWPDLIWPPATLTALARGRERLGDRIAAVDTWQRVLFWHPRAVASARALFQLAAVALADGDARGAVRLLEQAGAVSGIEPAFKAEIENRLEDLRPAAPAPKEPPAPTPPPVQPPQRPRG